MLDWRSGTGCLGSAYRQHSGGSGLSREDLHQLTTHATSELEASLVKGERGGANLCRAQAAHVDLTSQVSVGCRACGPPTKLPWRQFWQSCPLPGPDTGRPGQTQVDQLTSIETRQPVLRLELTIKWASGSQRTTRRRPGGYFRRREITRLLTSGHHLRCRSICQVSVHSTSMAGLFSA